MSELHGDLFSRHATSWSFGRLCFCDSPGKRRRCYVPRIFRWNNGGQERSRRGRRSVQLPEWVMKKAKRQHIIIIFLTSTNCYNAVRGHRTGSNNSGVEDYLRRTNANKRWYAQKLTRIVNLRQDYKGEIVWDTYHTLNELQHLFFSPCQCI